MIVMTVRNPVTKEEHLPIYIEPNETQLAQDWQSALKEELNKDNSHLEKNYCWHGWHNTQRDLKYLCDTYNRHADRLNANIKNYKHIDYIYPDTVMNPFTGINEDGKRGGGVNHDIMNTVHNHFEILQGTVEHLSDYYKNADPETKYSIRQINNLCHEIETLCLSLRKQYYIPEWVRPSQITTFLNVKRYDLTDEHRQGFLTNGYDRKFGYVYMHWTQIGKTLFEVFRDEHAADLTDAMCDAITHLKYYSGEFDIEWGRDVVYGNEYPWHTKEIDDFNNWLKWNKLNPKDPTLSLGYLEIGKINLQKSFGTEDPFAIWNIMGNKLDIYSIEVDDAKAVYNYSWADEDFEQRQIDFMMPGYMSHA